MRKTSYAQRDEAILNKIFKYHQKTYTGLISVLQGFQKCIGLNLSNPQHAELDLNKIEKLSTGPSQGERACFMGSEFILFEILD